MRNGKSVNPRAHKTHRVKRTKSLDESRAASARHLLALALSLEENARVLRSVVQSMLAGEWDAVVLTLRAYWLKQGDTLLLDLSKLDRSKRPTSPRTR